MCSLYLAKFVTKQTTALYLKPIYQNNFVETTVGFVYLFSVPEMIDGNTLTATVVDLNAWVEYEFRVLARNSVGVGEPSPASLKTRTEDAGESRHSTDKMMKW